MTVTEIDTGVWKSGKGKGRHTPKGRQVEDKAWSEVCELLGSAPRRRDLLIEYLHLIQDKYGQIIVNDHGATNIGRIFAAGDCTNVPYKQISVAMGQGSTASLGAFDYLIRN